MTRIAHALALLSLTACVEDPEFAGSRAEVLSTEDGGSDPDAGMPDAGPVPEADAAPVEQVVFDYSSPEDVQEELEFLLAAEAAPPPTTNPAANANQGGGWTLCESPA